MNESTPPGILLRERNQESEISGTVIKTAFLSPAVETAEVLYKSVTLIWSEDLDSEFSTFL